MGLLIGARENEICARKVGDITFAQLPNGNGIPTPVLSITGSKTEGSERDIPLPEALLRLGFLEYRVLGRDAEDPLFPELLPDPQTGKRAPAFSGWFTRYRQEIGIYVPRMDFHSMRGNFSTAISNVPGMNLGFADELTGHHSETRKSERDRYTKLIYIENLKSAIEAVPVPVDLSGLYYDGPRGVPAPNAAKIISEAVGLAEREKRKAVKRRPQTKAYRRTEPQRSDPSPAAPVITLTSDRQIS